MKKDLSDDEIKEESPNALISTSPLLLEDRIIDQELLKKILDDNRLFKKYLIITRSNHILPQGTTFKELAKNAIPIIICYGVGAIASYAYIDISLESGDSEAEKILVLISSVGLNLLFSGFFSLKVVSNNIIPLFKRYPDEIEKAMYEIQNLDYRRAAKIGRGVKAVAKIIAISIPAILSAYPSYAISKRIMFLAIMVLIATGAIQFNSVVSIIYKFIPFFLSPFKASIRKCSTNQKETHEIKSLIASFKSVHIETLESAHQQFLTLLQTNNEQDLASIYELLQHKNPSLEKTANLLMAVCQLGKYSGNEPSSLISICRLLFLVASIFLTTGSLPGYFLTTMKDAADSFSVSDFAEILLGSLIYSISIGLAYDISLIAFGMIYDLTVYGIQGIRETWRETTNLTDFIQKAWRGKSSMASWHTLIRFPLAIQQAPKSLLSLLAGSLVLAYYSSFPSLYLNKLQLGAEIAKYLVIPTIVTVGIFNDFPVPEILGDAEKTIAKLSNNKNFKLQIRLEEFIQEQITHAQSFDEGQFLKMLTSIVESRILNEQQKNAIIKMLLGNKTTADFYGKQHPYALNDFTNTITDVNSKKVRTIGSYYTKLSIFSSRKARSEKTALLEEEEYETGGTPMKTSSIEEAAP